MAHISYRIHVRGLKTVAFSWETPTVNFGCPQQTKNLRHADSLVYFYGHAIFVLGLKSVIIHS